MGQVFMITGAAMLAVAVLGAEMLSVKKSAADGVCICCERRSNNLSATALCPECDEGLNAF